MEEYVRPEERGDEKAIYAVTEAAFEGKSYAGTSKGKSSTSYDAMVISPTPSSRKTSERSSAMSPPH